MASIEPVTKTTVLWQAATEGNPPEKRKVGSSYQEEENKEEGRPAWRVSWGQIPDP